MFVVEVQEPEFRQCGRCGEMKRLAEFAWRRRRKLQRDNYCRACRSAYGKAHYEANKERYIQNAAAVTKKVRIERTRYLLDYFRSHPCVDCGESDPVVLEFDHLRDKSFDIAKRLVSARLGDDPRRDREVRGGVRELPPPANHDETWGTSRDARGR